MLNGAIRYIQNYNARNFFLIRDECIRGILMYYKFHYYNCMAEMEDISNQHLQVDLEIKVILKKVDI